ncbi:hypothetical protein TNCV_878581 [Trichonephila clavipes]|nr:hypothetical protein TNCV_878581 [Trichonephila clavipes]
MTRLLGERRHEREGDEEHYSSAFDDGYRSFEPWSSDEDVDKRAGPPSSNFHITPTRGRLSLDRFNVHRFPTRRIFRSTRLEFMTRGYNFFILTTRLPWPWYRPHHLTEAQNYEVCRQ